MKKTKLHELLAVLPDREKQSAAILKETKHTFKERNDLFFEINRKLDLFREEDTALATPDEHQAMTGTVPDKLKYVSRSMSRLYDTLLTQETANQNAVADLYIDGNLVAEGLPATFLLNMEKRLNALREIYLEVPTLPSGKDWVLDAQKGDYIYRSAKPETQYKTKKTVEHRVLYEATKEHPAQIEKWNDTKEVGLYTRDIWSSMVTSADKSTMLERLDTMIGSVKKARQRANSVEIDQKKIGQTLFDYIYKGIV